MQAYCIIEDTARKVKVTEYMLFIYYALNKDESARTLYTRWKKERIIPEEMTDWCLSQIQKPMKVRWKVVK